MKIWQFVSIVILGWGPFLAYANLPKPPIEVRDSEAHRQIVEMQKELHTLHVLYGNIHRVDREVAIYNDTVQDFGRQLHDMQYDFDKVWDKVHGKDKPRDSKSENGPMPTPPKPAVSEQSQGLTRTDGKVY